MIKYAIYSMLGYTICGIGISLTATISPWFIILASCGIVFISMINYRQGANDIKQIYNVGIVKK